MNKLDETFKKSVVLFVGLLGVAAFVPAVSFAKTKEAASSSTCGVDLIKSSETSGTDQTAHASDVNTIPPSKFYNFEVKTIDGAAAKLSDYRGKVVMVVNTASRCGFTSQYKELQDVFAKYRDKGFVVLGFPSNDFLGQEPGSNKQIKEFCETNFNIKFPLFEKGPVTGDAIQPLFRYLTKEADSKMSGNVAWNFEKFILSRDGQLVGRFRSLTKPTSGEVTKLIEKSLNDKPKSEATKGAPTCS
jgi:glutathione peroxidase